MFKKFLTLYAICIFMCISLSAEPDNGKFVPDAELLLPNHVFFEAGGGFNFPVEFFNQGNTAMTGNGGSISAAFGYNWSGWLTDIHYTHDSWGQGKGQYALMENFRNNIAEVRIRKIISKKAINWFPKMLEVIPGFGLGVNFITTDYYPSVRAKEEGRLNSVELGAPNANCFFYRAGLELALNGITDMFIPFIGFDYNAFYDTSIGGGFAGFARLYAGVRMYPFGIVNDIKRITEDKAQELEKQEKFVESWPAPSAKVWTDNNDNFTPDGDGINDIALFELRTEYLETEPQEWKLSIYDQKNNEIKSWSGQGRHPSSVEWDGKSETDEVVFSRNEYKVVFTVIPSEKDIERTGSNELSSSVTIKTGILFHVIIPDKKWKIIVNTIYFDPDRASFEKISEEQQRENKETLESITRQILEHGEVEVVVEGYANNVSNTERENIQELIPLSRLRAQTIMNILIQNGLDEAILSFDGKGGSNPIAKWEDHDNWWKNRRVEFTVTRKE